MTVPLMIMSKVVVTTAIALLAEAVRRRTMRPEPAYALWLTVLAVLIMPSVVTVPISNRVSLSVASHWLNNIFGGLPLCLAATIWLTGSGFILWRHLQSLRILDRLVRFAAPVPAIVSERCAMIANALKIHECPKVLTAAGAFSPFLWHPLVGTPRVVIPDELLGRLSIESVESILRHELIHLRRHDTWRRRLEVLVLALWWWLPTTWIARRRLRELEELCTDESVLKANPHGAKAYARALLDTEEFLSHCKSREVVVVPAFASEESLKSRIARIVAHDPNSITRTSKVLTGGLALILLSLGFLTADVSSSAFNDAYARNDSGDNERQSKSGSAKVRESVTVRGAVRETVRVRELDREIIMTRSSNRSGSAELFSIRLVRISDDHIEPRVWTIDSSHDGKPADKNVNRRELEWLFTLLEVNNEIIDGNGTRHRHPGLAHTRTKS